MTSFLFAAVAVSGMAIIAKGVPFNRRNRFILTAGLVFGYGGILLPGYFSNVFTYDGDNTGLRGFLDAIVLVMETGFAVTAALCMFLNLVLPEEFEDIDADDTASATGRPEHVVGTKEVGRDDVDGTSGSRGFDSEDIRPAEGDTYTEKGNKTA